MPERFEKREIPSKITLSELLIEKGKTLGRYQRNLNEKLNLAVFLAEKYHQGQKYGDKDYIYHLDQVVTIITESYSNKSDSSYSLIEIMTAGVVAYLHDSLEDTSLTYEVLEENFGSYVADNVSLLTDEPGKNRKERKARTNKKLKEAKVEDFHPALRVKVADRLANVREAKANNPGLLKMYRKEHEEFKKAVFREGSCESIWKELDKLIEGQE